MCLLHPYAWRMRQVIRLSTLFQASQRRCHGVFEQHDIGIEYLPTKHLLVNSKIKFLFAVQVLYKRGKEKKNHSYPHFSVIFKRVKLYHTVISCLYNTLNLDS